MSLFEMVFWSLPIYFSLFLLWCNRECKAVIAINSGICIDILIYIYTLSSCSQMLVRERRNDVGDWWNDVGECAQNAECAHFCENKNTTTTKWDWDRDRNYQECEWWNNFLCYLMNN